MGVRRLAVMLSAALAIASVNLVPAHAEGPILDDVGRRVSVPEAGLELTLPTSWGIRVLMQESGGSLPQLVGIATIWRVLEAKAPRRYPEPGTGGCELLLARPSQPEAGPLSIDEIIQTDGRAFWQAPEFDGEVVTTEVELPAGKTSLVDVVERDHDGTWFGANYRLATDDGIAWLMCLGFEARPDDGWRGIADTLRPLPDGPWRMTPFEVEFPRDWSVRDPSSLGVLSEEALWAAVGVVDELGPSMRPDHVAVPKDGSAQMCFAGGQVGVVDGRSTDLEEVLTAATIAAEAHPEQAVLDSAIAELPAGWAARIDVLGHGGISISTYYVTDGQAWAYLQCTADDPPPDRWLSIAETFEFLPGE